MLANKYKMECLLYVLKELEVRVWVHVKCAVSIEETGEWDLVKHLQP